MRRTARLLIVFLALACGPLGPLPGGKLSGEPMSAPVGDWSFLDDEDTVQLETRPDDPYSVNVWIGHYQGNPYIPTSLIAGVDEPGERQWVQNVTSDPRVRLRVSGQLYPRNALRVEDPAELEAVRAILIAKYEVEPSDDGQESSAWIFRLEPR
jgi:hypothetical protein